jgi:hypothetical protein
VRPSSAEQARAADDASSVHEKGARGGALLSSRRIGYRFFAAFFFAPLAAFFAI